MCGKVGLVLFFVLFLIVPLIFMFTKLSGVEFNQVVTSGVFSKAIVNSLTATLIATAISLLLAYTLAYCIQRTAVPLKGFFSESLLLPMLIPSISHGMGLIILLGNNGLITNFLHLKTSIYGLPGIVLGSVLYSFPVAFLMLNDVMKYEDSSPYEAASVLGISAKDKLFAITLPYLRKPLITVIFAAFTLILTDYGVPLMVGGKFNTVPVVMYQEVIGQLNYAKGCVYGLVLLIPAIVAFLFDLFNHDKNNATHTVRYFKPERRPLRDALALIFCILIFIFVSLPILAFVILTFAKGDSNHLTFTLDNINDTFRLGGGRYIINSIMIALATSLLGIVICFFSGYLTARVSGSRSGKLLHLSIITSAAVPGIVLGLCYALAFNASFIYGTVVILIVVNMIHFISSPYLMMYNSFCKMNANLEAVGQTLGIRRWFLLLDVFLPSSKGTLFEMFSYFFVNCMMTISAVSFLANTDNKPIALMINQFEAQNQIKCAAFVSLMILIVNLVIKGIVRTARKRTN